MAYNYKVGNFQLNTSTGNQSISGLGFQPKAVIFFHQPQTVAIGVPQIANWYQSIGMSDGTNTYSMWAHSPNGAGTESAGYMQTTLAIIGGNNFSTVWGAALQSLDGDGFTINITVAPPLGYQVGYMALGGGDLDVAVGTFNASGVTGSQAVTGVGFQPTGLLINTLGRTEAYTASPIADVTAAGVRQSFGMSDGTNTRSSGYSLRDSGVGVFISGVYQSNTAIIANPLDSATNGLYSSANLTSFDAGGFTLNWTNAAGAGAKHIYLAIGGAQTKVGNYNTPTVTGVTKVVSGLLFTPNAVITTSSNQTAYNVLEGNGQFGGGAQGSEYSHGFATDELEQYNIEATQVDFVTPSYSGHYVSDVALHARYEYNNRGILREQSNFEAFDTDGFEINATTVVGSGNSRISYMAIEGDGGVTPPPENPTGGSGDPNSPDSIFLNRFIDL